MPTTKIRGNTQIEALTITNAEIATAAAIANSKLAGDPVVAATANKIVLRDASGRAQIADPSAAADIASKNYVDAQVAALSSGIDIRASCRAATTTNITLSGAQTIDGVSVIAGNRVLVKNQSTGSQNGIYVCAAGAWSRATDADSDAEVTAGMFTWIEEGTTNGDSGWVLTTDDPITVGTTTLTFVQFSGAGQITAGAGLTKTGNQLDVGAGNGIQVNADSVEVIYGVVGEVAASAVGDAAAAGTTNKAARVDHKHAREAFGTPGSSAVGDSVNAGSATTLARSDHRHGREAFATPSIALGSAAAAGSATTPIRSDATIAAFDATNPSTQAIGDTAVIGTAAYAARRDHKHAMPGFSVPVASFPAHGTFEGVSSSIARADHRHARETWFRNSFTGDGTTVAFTGSNTNIGEPLVFLNGVLQQLGASEDYTRSGITITFATAPANGDKIHLAYEGY